MQTFCTGKLVGIAPYCHNVAAMPAQMKSVGMTHNYLELVLAVIRTVEQPLARAMSQQHDSLLRRDTMQQMLHLLD